jgi:hypothetical protein
MELLFFYILEMFLLILLSFLSSCFNASVLAYLSFVFSPDFSYAINELLLSKYRLKSVLFAIFIFYVFFSFTSLSFMCVTRSSM